MSQAARQHSKWEDLRKRAEKILHERSLSESSWPEKDFLLLIHELEVHQVELEIQGEELRAKNQELEELLHRYSDLYHNAPTGFVNLNKKGVIVEANFSASNMLGLPGERLRNRGFSRFIHIEDQKIYFECLKNLTKIPSGKGLGDLRLIRDQGLPFYVHFEVVPLRDDRSVLHGFQVAFIDISGRKRAEGALQKAYGEIEESQRQLKRLSARLISSLEDERKRIARELHDSIGQTLAAMKFSIENALESRNLRKPEGAFTLLERLVPLVQSAIEEVRNIYMGLRPSILDDLGIIAALQWLCREFSDALPGLHIEMSIAIDENDVPENLKIVIFRIAQEALNNVAKHSGAEWVDLSLVRSKSGIELTVEDNGRGFDLGLVDQSREPTSMGLVNMRERAVLSGGSLSIGSVEGRGTSIHAVWNL